MLVISGDAGRQKTVFFTLTLLTLQARNCRDAVLIGKLSKFDMGEQKTAYSFYSGYLSLCVVIYISVYTNYH